MNNEAAILEADVKRITPHSTGLLIAVSGLTLLDGVNGALVSTLRPYLMGSFSATPDQITWAAICYYAVKLFALLTAARVQERFGQRNALLGASTLLVLATAGGLWMTNYPALLIAQSLQGAGGGLVLALGQGNLLMSFDRRRQPLVQAIFALAAVMFPATLVPALLGGYACGSDWRLAYVWMLLLGSVSYGWLFWRRKFLKTLTSHTTVPVFRIALLTTLLFCVAYLSQQGNRHAWLESSRIVWPALLAAACLTGLGFAESNGRPTYLRYGGFRFADFTFGVSVSLLAGLALFSSGFVIPGFLGGVLEYPAWHSGLAQGYAAGFATVSLLAVGVTLRFTKFPQFGFVALGLLLFGTAMWNLGKLPANAGFSSLLPWLALRGLALGCLFLPLTLMTLVGVPSSAAVAAAGLFNFGRQIGGLAGAAWMQTLQTHLVARNQTVLSETLSAANPNFSTYVEAARNMVALQGASPDKIPALANALTLQEAHRQMSCIAFNGCFQTIAMIFVFSLPLVIAGRILTARWLKHSA
jgi:DHA2 family multidrug resistance protein